MPQNGSTKTHVYETKINAAKLSDNLFTASPIIEKNNIGIHINDIMLSFRVQDLSYGSGREDHKFLNLFTIGLGK